MSTLSDVNALDPRSLAEVKRLSRENSPAGLKAAAKQFEAVFMQMVLKSMRDATPKDELMDSEQTRMYESLLDQQLAQVLSGKGGTGLAAMIEKQLSRATAVPGDESAGLPGLPLVPASKSFSLESAARALNLPDPALAPQALPAAPISAIPAMPVNTTDADGQNTAGRQGNVAGNTASAFVARVWPDALAASQETGIPARFLVAHAALETGWGKSEPRRADGSPSFNLFGIKAGRKWAGDSVLASTTEYIDGQSLRKNESFRAYGSYTEAFRDYARLLKENPRYKSVLAAENGAQFAQGLQQAGYATDPLYAQKLSRIIASTSLQS